MAETKWYDINAIYFVKEEWIKTKNWLCKWYDNLILYCNGRGERADKAYIDMSLPKNYLREIVVPACMFAKDIFILDKNDNFIKSDINEVLIMLN